MPHQINATMPEAGITDDQRAAILMSAAVLRSLEEQVAAIVALTKGAVCGELVAQAQQARARLQHAFGVTTSIDAGRAL